jgi:hypothetical protein
MYNVPDPNQDHINAMFGILRQQLDPVYREAITAQLRRLLERHAGPSPTHFELRLMEVYQEADAGRERRFEQRLERRTRQLERNARRRATRGPNRYSGRGSTGGSEEASP